MKKLKKMKEIFWMLVIHAKLRCGWILYNLIYIHMFRMRYPNETFERISFNKWWNLVFDDIYQKLGLERENRVS